ncbi:hypothetical protein EHE19_010385 [Ruminiclostridium herbifermentans]|uniref:Uncharacterized protein n=1 Tax=Ruminiclostridium herbifermentans TaxID=2488810 RepID=A0A4U7JII7_9FIRM|nr:hypothetical protein [Ruminiclostridium herbifermentans]QNU65348.1 hypothetical protein EHE19_010385 [Ruminiclostridium herbifermentans]
MKKHIIIGALILTIATSMTAGTFATYTKTLSPITGSVAAKSFYIGNNETYFPDIELAPSEKTEWNFEVVNFNADGTVNAVDTDMTISLNVAAEADKQPIDGLNVSIYDENNNQVGTTVIKNGQMSFDVEKAFTANSKAAQKYKLIAEWKNSNSNNIDTLNAENKNATAISVTITGTQCLHK